MVLAALLGAACCCAGQAPAKPQTVSGQVVDGITGEPIARALVQLGTQHAALTDHEGRFEFDDVMDGSYSPPQASRPGYFSGNDMVLPGSRPAILKLIPEAILSGTVLDGTGQPVQAMLLELNVLQVSNGQTGWQQIQSTTTNVEGEFRFSDLQAGKYRVVSSYQVEGLPDAPSSLAFLPVIYPAAAGDRAGDALTLAPGNHVVANLNLSAEKIYPVTGVVSGPVNRGVSFEVQTAEGNAVSAGSRIFPETGSFRLMLPSGLYRLTLRSFMQPQQLMGTREITVGHAALQGVSISLAPAATIPVEIDYQAIEANTQPGLPDRMQQVYLSLRNTEEGGPRLEHPAVPVRQEPNAPLAIQNVDPGQYHLAVQPNPPWYLASAICGAVDLLHDPLVIAEGSGACSIRAVMRNDSATLHWSVEDADSATLSKEGGASSSAAGPMFVAAIPLDNLTQPEATGTFAAAGTGTPGSIEGSFANMAPGRYLVIALPHQQDIAFRDADGLKRYQPLGQEVTLERNGHADIKLHLAAMPAGEP